MCKKFGISWSMQFSLLDQLRVAKMEKLLVQCHLDASVWDFTTVTSITREVHFPKAANIKATGQNLDAYVGSQHFCLRNKVSYLLEDTCSIITVRD